MEKAKMIEEAVTRMRLLKLWDDPGKSIIQRFAQERELYVSTPAPGGRVGTLYVLSGEEIRLVKEFEERSGGLVYHVIRNEVEIHPSGTEVQYSLLYVSDREDEWAQDKEGLSDPGSEVQYLNAYVHSVADIFVNVKSLSDGYGEFREIGVMFGFGGLLRVF